MTQSLSWLPRMVRTVGKGLGCGGHKIEAV
jgi:hypothetical protein